jgi:hypothetical protein
MRRHLLMGDTNKCQPMLTDSCIAPYTQQQNISFIFGRQVYKEELEVRKKVPLIPRLESSVATTVSLFYGCFVTKIVYQLLCENSLA